MMTIHALPRIDALAARLRFAAAVADGVRTWRGGFEPEIAELDAVMSELPVTMSEEASGG